jgi:hypothetical protein
LTFSRYTYEQTRNEGTERRSFGEILAKLHQQILSCTASNLDVAPSLIEQTNRLVGINLSVGASINNQVRLLSIIFSSVPLLESCNKLIRML